MRIWVDIENPPQVQYLTPLAAEFAAQGAEVVITARDYGSTFALLEARGVSFHRLGSSYGKEKWRKATGLLGRTATLARFLVRQRPDAAVHAGRASALAATALRVPSFSFRDYEYVSLTIDRLTRSFVVFPDAIDAASFTKQGVRADRLLPFAGLKEDLSFAGIDPAEIEPHDLGSTHDGVARVLVRPPAEESHYYSSESGRVFQALLGHLAGEERAQVVFSPRYAWQAAYLDDLEWRNDPIVIGESVPFVPLLNAVDAVVGSGGTMAREAAYLGLPSFSIFQGRIGGVDQRLAESGRLQLLSGKDIARLDVGRLERLPLIERNPALPAEIVGMVLDRVARP
jgi:predicted glycosyltransferase